MAAASLLITLARRFGKNRYGTGLYISGVGNGSGLIVIDAMTIDQAVRMMQQRGTFRALSTSRFTVKSTTEGQFPHHV